MRIPFDALASGERSPKAPEEVRHYDSLPGWEEAAAEVRATGHVPPHVVDAAGTMIVAMKIDAMTPSLVYDLAMFWTRHASFEERLAVEKAAFAAKQGPYADGAGPAPAVAESGIRTKSDVGGEQDNAPVLRAATRAKRR